MSAKEKNAFFAPLRLAPHRNNCRCCIVDLAREFTHPDLDLLDEPAVDLARNGKARRNRETKTHKNAPGQQKRTKRTPLSTTTVVPSVCLSRACLGKLVLESSYYRCKYYAQQICVFGSVSQAAILPDEFPIRRASSHTCKQ